MYSWISTGRAGRANRAVDSGNAWLGAFVMISRLNRGLAVVGSVFLLPPVLQVVEQQVSQELARREALDHKR